MIIDKRWMGPALFVSVALNVFAAGYFFGGPSHHDYEHHAGGSAGGYGGSGNGGIMHRQLDKLNDADRDKAQAIMDQYKPKLKTQSQQTRALRQEISDELKSTHYARKDAETMFAQLRETTGKSQSLAEQMMLDIADILPADERAGFFDHPKREESHDAGHDDTGNTAAAPDEGNKSATHAHRHRRPKADDEDTQPQEQ